MGETPGNGSGSRDRQRRSEGSLDLDSLREEIEAVDEEIVETVARRTYIAESIAEVKMQEGREINDPEREEVVYDRVAEKAEALGIDPERTCEIFEILIEMSKEKQRSHADTEASE
ncbi:chorismate mutase [Halorutilales archaeon Cl-col2-1]